MEILMIIWLFPILSLFHVLEEIIMHWVMDKIGALLTINSKKS